MFGIGLICYVTIAFPECIIFQWIGPMTFPKSVTT